MPTTILGNTNDSQVGNSHAVWGNCRGLSGTTGNQYSNSNSVYNFGIYNIYSGGRGGNTYYIRRSYFIFDLSGESGTVESAEVNLYLDNLGSTDSNSKQVIMVRPDSLDGSTADFGNVFSTGATPGETFSDIVDVSTTAGYHTFTMTSGAISRINSAVGSADFVVGLMGYYYDHQNNAPSLSGAYTKIQIRYADYFGTSYDPKIELTYAAVAADNATFFGANF